MGSVGEKKEDKRFNIGRKQKSKYLTAITRT